MIPPGRRGGLCNFVLDWRSGVFGLGGDARHIADDGGLVEGGRCSSKNELSARDGNQNPQASNGETDGNIYRFREFT